MDNYFWITGNSLMTLNSKTSISYDYVSLQTECFLLVNPLYPTFGAQQKSSLVSMHSAQKHLYGQPGHCQTFFLISWPQNIGTSESIPENFGSGNRPLPENPEPTREKRSSHCTDEDSEHTTEDDCTAAAEAGEVSCWNGRAWFFKIKVDQRD